MKKNKLADFFAGFSKFDINDPQFERIGSWPGVVKLTLLALLALIIVGATGHFVISDKNEQLERVQEEENRLRAEYRSKANQVANLEVLQQQRAELAERFEILRAQLPTDQQLPDLFEAINIQAQQSGLEIERSIWGNEVNEELFVQRPIDMVVTGGYHQLGNFVSGVASLARIVTVHDFTISRNGSPARNASTVPLRMQLQIRTYRYREQDN